MTAQRDIREFAFENTTGETIPPFACMEIDSVTGSGNEIVFRVKKPTYTLEQSQDVSRVLFNLGAEVGENKGGRCTIDYPAQVVVSGTIAIAEICGPEMGQWYLTVGRPGFLIKSLDPCNSYFSSATLRSCFIEPNCRETEVVKVTSTTKDGNGYYPGEVHRFDVTSKTWSAVRNCLVRDANS